jgi:hypothetical protein
LTKNLRCRLVLSINLDKNVFYNKNPQFKQGLPMVKKLLLMAVFVSTLLFLAVRGMQLANLVRANPYLYYKSVSPPGDVKPPIISVSTLKNNTVFDSNTTSLAFNVSIPEKDSYGLYLHKIWLERDWSDSVATIYQYPVGSGRWISDFFCERTLAGIPEGFHNVTLVVRTHGGYAEGLTAYSFGITTVLSLYFTVDTISPRILIESDENKTYETSDIPLKFTVNESVIKVSYSLDELDNVTIAGNTTLTSLSIGVHNIAVYAWDKAGNVGSSETLFFNIAEPEPEPPPTILVVAPIASASFFAGVLLVYFKKNRRGKVP